MNVEPPSNWYEDLGFCRTPLTNINNTASKSINCDEEVESFSKLNI